jgi:hypothetical protein
VANTWLPLEKRLEELGKTVPGLFAHPQQDYWAKYQALVSYLRTSVYPNIDAGLACLSKSPGLFTNHGPDHFDEVVRYAGLIVDPEIICNDESALRPYELFVMLAAIRLHDAGNMFGRETHERKAAVVLKSAGNAVCADNFEVNLISKIAEAHGGTSDKGDKDTIGALPEVDKYGSAKIRPRLIAALVRFADEICEHSNRASNLHLATHTMPADNRLFHLYAHGVKASSPDRDRKALAIKIVFETSDLKEQYPTPGNPPKTKFLIDDAMDRVAKLDRERRYCNRFLDQVFRTDLIELEVDIVQPYTVMNQALQRLWDSQTIVIRDVGYPSDGDPWGGKGPIFIGSDVARRLEMETTP